jgi:hypothetical protein
MRKLLSFAMLIAVATPSFAQTMQSQPLQADPKKGDANKIVCQSEEQIGSRLGAKKVCLTAQQWQERKAADREQTERVQEGARAPSSGG